MARLVKRDATGPMKIETTDGDKFICMCGLSHDQPFCDGNHKQARAEDADKLYKYVNGERIEVGDFEID